jgi:hypothetical protein
MASPCRRRFAWNTSLAQQPELVAGQRGAVNHDGGRGPRAQLDRGGDLIGGAPVVAAASGQMDGAHRPAPADAGDNPGEQVVARSPGPQVTLGSAVECAATALVDSGVRGWLEREVAEGGQESASPHSLE